LANVYSIADPRQVLTLRSEGQGHRVIKCAAGLDLEFDTTAQFSIIF